MVSTRLIDPSRFIASAAQRVGRQMEARVSDFKCDEHQRVPDGAIESTPSGGIGVHFDPCCTPFRERVRVLIGIEREEG